MDIVGRTLLGKYKVERLLGQGGMGSVWLGRHMVTGRQVAVKVLDDRFLSSAAVVQRFGREARSASAIQHEGIVEVLDLDMTEEGVPFLVMEFLEGESLARRIERKGRLSEEETVRLGAQLCDALHAAHEAGVIHRDLKPDNIFVVPTGRRGDRVKILDFGISSKVDETAKLTVTGSVLGTPHYMSPEQAAGDGEIDRRADIYALGVVLYECVVGQVPFDAPNYNRLLRVVLEGKPTPPTDRGAMIRRAVEEVILRAMARRPDDRPPSASALKAELLAAQQAPAQPPRGSSTPTLAAPPVPAGPSTLPPPPEPASEGQLAVARAEAPRWDLDSLPAQSSPLASRSRSKPRLDAPAAAISGLEDLGPAPPPANLEIDGEALQAARKQTRISVPPAAEPEPSPAAPRSSTSAPRSGTSAPRTGRMAQRSDPPPPPPGPVEQAQSWWQGLSSTARLGIQAGVVGTVVFALLVVGLRQLVRPETAADSVRRDPITETDAAPSRDWVLVEVDNVPDGAELRLDGLPGVRLPLRIRAGTTHTLEIRAAGYEPRRLEIRGEEGARVDAAMTTPE